MILPAWFDHLQESLSHKEVQVRKFCPPVKTSHPPDEYVHETLDFHCPKGIYSAFIY